MYRASLPRLKDFESRGNWVLAYWEYLNNKYLGGRLQRPYIIRIMKETKNTKMMGGWHQKTRQFLFSPRIFNNEVVARAVIAHEMAHQCQHELGGDPIIGGQKSHTETWAHYMKVLKQKPNAKMSGEDAEKLQTKEERETLNKYRNTRDAIAKTSSPFLKSELNTPMGLCAKIPGGSSGEVVLGRIICKRSGGKFYFVDTENRVWNIDARSLYKVSPEEQKMIIPKVPDSLIMQGVNWYNNKLKERREKAVERKEFRKRFGAFL